MTPPPAHGAADTPDAQLVAAAQRGDHDALDTLLRRHHDRIFVLCRRLCRDRGDAEDAAQNALIAIVRGLPQFSHDAAFTTWSYRVATNACLDELRRRGRRPLPVEPPDEDGTALLATPTVPRGADPAEIAVATERRGVLQRALDELPEEFRLPVVLRDVADMDYAEIGEQLGLPPGTVRSRIARGRAKLAQLLDHTDLSPGNPSSTADVSPQDAP